MWPQSARAPQSVHDLFNYRAARLLSASSLPILRLCEAQYGIARRQWGVIAVLGFQGEMSPSALAVQGNVDRPRASRMLSQLVQKGMVERTEKQGDRRQAVVRLTPKGRAVFDALLPQVAELNRQLLSVLNDSELVVLDDMLTRLGAKAREMREQCDVAPTQRRLGGRASDSV